MVRKVATTKRDGGGASVYDVSPAGFWARVVASLVDSLIIFAIFLPLVPLIYGSFEVYFLSEEWHPADTINTVFWAFVTILLWVYWGGKTPGKAVLGMHIVRVDGKPIGWREALLRYLGYVINVITLGIGFLIVAFRPDKRGLHDIIAGTRVVYSDEVRKYRVSKR